MVGSGNAALSIVSRPDRIRAIVADDHDLFRAGLAHLLSSDERLDVVGEARDGEEAIRLARELRPDVVLADLKMPRATGSDVVRRLAEEVPETRVVILTAFDADGLVYEALSAGAAGYLLKDTPIGVLVSSLIAALGDECVIAAHPARRLLSSLGGTAARRESLGGLTDREVEVLQLVATGLSNKQIARRLGLQDKTVRNHVAHIYDKLRIHDRSQALLYAIRKGLVEP